LQDIEGGTLRGEQAACRPPDVHQAGTLRDALAIPGEHIHLHVLVIAPEDAGSDVDARDDDRLASVHGERAPLVGFDHHLRREVAGAHVLGKPQIDQAVRLEFVVHAGFSGGRGRGYDRPLLN
jgi:hypothetical protein